MENDLPSMYPLINTDGCYCPYSSNERQAISTKTNVYTVEGGINALNYLRGSSETTPLITVSKKKEKKVWRPTRFSRYDPPKAPPVVTSPSQRVKNTFIDNKKTLYSSVNDMGDYNKLNSSTPGNHTGNKLQEKLQEFKEHSNTIIELEGIIEVQEGLIEVYVKIINELNDHKSVMEK